MPCGATHTACGWIAVCMHAYQQLLLLYVGSNVLVVSKCFLYVQSIFIGLLPSVVTLLWGHIYWTPGTVCVFFA